VYVAPEGTVYIRNQSRFFRRELPDAWLVGVFGPAAPDEVIEDALLERMREISAEQVRGAA
jgi:hypothetical protein